MRVVWSFALLLAVLGCRRHEIEPVARRNLGAIRDVRIIPGAWNSSDKTQVVADSGAYVFWFARSFPMGGVKAAATKTAFARFATRNCKGSHLFTSTC